MKNQFRLLINKYPIELFLFFITVIKLFFAYFLPVVGDETYYWFWGQHLQLSYFDHPAGVAVLTNIANLLPISNIGLSIRWPFVIISSLTLFITYKTFPEGSSKKLISLFLLFTFLNPLLGLGSILATPDVLFLFFWSLSFYFFTRALNKKKSHYYALLGVSLGLGFCSKYHIVIFPIAAFITILLTGQLKNIKWPFLSLTFATGLLFSAPVIVWNFQNDFQSFQFQLKHGFESKSYVPSWILFYILGQILIFSPLFFIQLFKKPYTRIEKLFGLSNWGFFLLSSFKASVEANWPLASHLNGLSVFELYKNRRTVYLSLIYYFVLWTGLIVFLFTDKGITKWQSLPQSNAAFEIYTDTKNIFSDGLPIYGPTYQMSSLLHKVSHKEILKLPELSRFDFYDDLQKNNKPTGDFYVYKYDLSAWPLWIKNKKIIEIKKINTYKLALYLVKDE